MDLIIPNHSEWTLTNVAVSENVKGNPPNSVASSIFSLSKSSHLKKRLPGKSTEKFSDTEKCGYGSIPIDTNF